MDLLASQNQGSHVPAEGLTVLHVFIKSDDAVTCDAKVCPRIVLNNVTPT